MDDGRAQLSALCSLRPVGRRHGCVYLLKIPGFYAALPHLKQVVVKMPRQIFCVSLRRIV
jgi:hypothetical protein